MHLERDVDSNPVVVVSQPPPEANSLLGPGPQLVGARPPAAGPEGSRATRPAPRRQWPTRTAARGPAGLGARRSSGVQRPARVQADEPANRFIGGTFPFHGGQRAITRSQSNAGPGSTFPLVICQCPSKPDHAASSFSERTSIRTSPSLPLGTSILDPREDAARGPQPAYRGRRTARR